MNQQMAPSLHHNIMTSCDLDLCTANSTRFKNDFHLFTF